MQALDNFSSLRSEDVAAAVHLSDKLQIVDKKNAAAKAAGVAAYNNKLFRYGRGGARGSRWSDAQRAVALHLAARGSTGLSPRHTRRGRTLPSVSPSGRC